MKDKPSNLLLGVETPGGRVGLTVDTDAKIVRRQIFLITIGQLLLQQQNSSTLKQVSTCNTGTDFTHTNTPSCSTQISQ